MYLITKNSVPLDSASCQYILQWHMCIDNRDVIDKLLKWFIGLTLFSVLYTGKLSQEIKYSNGIKKLIFPVKKPLASACFLNVLIKDKKWLEFFRRHITVVSPFLSF